MLYVTTNKRGFSLFSILSQTSIVKSWCACFVWKQLCSPIPQIVCAFSHVRKACGIVSLPKLHSSLIGFIILFPLTRLALTESKFKHERHAKFLSFAWNVQALNLLANLACHIAIGDADQSPWLLLHEHVIGTLNRGLDLWVTLSNEIIIWKLEAWWHGFDHISLVG